MWSIGLDVHQFTSTFCILDENGKVVKSVTVRGGRAKLVAALRKIKRPFVICYEASCGYGTLHDALRTIARRVVVAHPGQLRLIFRSKNKNDRSDAKKLATLLFLDQVPTVHVPTQDVRAWRSLIEFRTRVVAKRVRVKNALRALLRSQGLERPTGKRLWTRAGLAWLATVTLPTDAEALQRDLLLDELASHTACLGRIEKVLDATGQTHPGVHLLRTIPGVGPRTAEAVVAYLDDANRFARSKQVGRYFGLVPSQDRSAHVNRLGHITREGPSTVRKLLTEAAWQGIRHCPHLKAYFERIRGDDGKRRKIALVATAHYLVRVMHAMLRTGETCRWETGQNPAA